MSNAVAPAGTIYVCGACGKLSRDKYGMQALSRGWDESCMMNAVLCYAPPELVVKDDRVGCYWELAEGDGAIVDNGEWRRIFAAIKWTEPVKVAVPDIGDRYACRICAALSGLLGSRVSHLVEEPGPIEEHIKKEHPTWVTVDA